MSAPAVVLDGRARFGCSLGEFYRQPVIVSEAARRGFLIPSENDVATDAPPALAYVDHYDGTTRWLAACPDCPFGRDVFYVWLEGPPAAYFLQCGNKAAGGKFRPVRFPTNRRAIEDALAVRPPDRRCWLPWETVEQLWTENGAMGWRA